MINIQGEWSYRVPFAVQWVWPLPLAVACMIAPESPWWLARKDRLAEAEASLRRLCSAPDDVINPRQTLAMIIETLRLEKETLMIQGSYLDCFKGTNLRRTEIAIVSWGCQILPGFIIQNYSTYFFTLAGLPATNAFKMSVGELNAPFLACQVRISNGGFPYRQLFHCIYRHSTLVVDLNTIWPPDYLYRRHYSDAPSHVYHWVPGVRADKFWHTMGTGGYTSCLVLYLQPLHRAHPIRYRHGSWSSTIADQNHLPKSEYVLPSQHCEHYSGSIYAQPDEPQLKGKGCIFTRGANSLHVDMGILPTSRDERPDT